MKLRRPGQICTPLGDSHKINLKQVARFQVTRKAFIHPHPPMHPLQIQSPIKRAPAELFLLSCGGLCPVYLRHRSWSDHERTTCSWWGAAFGAANTLQPPCWRRRGTGCGWWENRVHHCNQEFGRGVTAEEFCPAQISAEINETTP